MKGSGHSLLVRADASPQIGAGHIMRCLALSKAWQDSGGNVTFACAEILPVLERRLEEEHLEVAAIETAAGSQEDVQRTNELSRELDVDWIVVDGYQFAPGYHRDLKQRNLRCLTIEDDGRLDDYCADVVLNPSATATEAMYAHKAAHTRLLLGSRFALLRPEFRRAQRKRDYSKIASRLLVTMGGSDPENVTLKVLSALKGIVSAGAEIRVVAGSGYQGLEELKAFAAGMPGKVRVEDNPSDMASLMSWADLAVSAAGGTCWELAYMGVPAVLITISHDQHGNTQAAEECGLACSLGWHADASPRQIEGTVQMLLRDGQRRRLMSQAGMELVDGQGAERVVDFLQSFL
jgi:UDP-2,4-diacetamido-2,4,6-trideoxy-beta-L-altropyranose hydrolase